MITKLIPALLLVVMAAASSVAVAQSPSDEVNRSAFPYTPVGSPNIE